MKKLKVSTILSFFFLFACSEPQSELEKRFIKACYFGSQTKIDKAQCSCLYKKALENYSEDELDRVLQDNISQDQMAFEMQKLFQTILNKYTQCK